MPVIYAVPIKTSKDVISVLLPNDTLTSAFQNLATLAVIVSVIPVTTCSVERSMKKKILKTRLRNLYLVTHHFIWLDINTDKACGLS